MVEDRLIIIKTKYITVEKKMKDKGNKTSTVEADELNKFCDGETCEVPVLIDKNC